MPAAPRSRKPLPLSDSLARSLHLYAIAAAASGLGLASAQPCQAEVIYTPAHRFVGRDQKIGIDFNHDHRMDFVIREFPWNLIGYPGNVVEAVAEPKGGIERGKFAFAAQLSAGAQIGASDLFLQKSAYIASATYYGVYYGYVGSWSFSSSTGYLGVRFLIDGETHYGWARLQLHYNFETRQIDVLMTGYAYETQPNTLIRAGDTGQITEPEDKSPAEGPSEEKSENAPAANQESRQPATLGALAAGASGVPLWRPANTAPIQQ